MYCQQGFTVKPSEDAYCCIAHRKDENIFGSMHGNFTVVSSVVLYLQGVVKSTEHQLQCEDSFTLQLME